MASNFFYFNSILFTKLFGVFNFILLFLKNNSNILLLQMLLPLIGFFVIILYNSVSKKINSRLIWEFSF